MTQIGAQPADGFPGAGETAPAPDAGAADAFRKKHGLRPVRAETVSSDSQRIML